MSTSMYLLIVQVNIKFSCWVYNNIEHAPQNKAHSQVDGLWEENIGLLKGGCSYKLKQFRVIEHENVKSTCWEGSEANLLKNWKKLHANPSATLSTWSFNHCQSGMHLTKFLHCKLCWVSLSLILSGYLNLINSNFFMVFNQSPKTEINFSSLQYFTIYWECLEPWHNNSKNFNFYVNSIVSLHAHFCAKCFAPWFFIANSTHPPLSQLLWIDMLFDLQRILHCILTTRV